MYVFTDTVGDSMDLRTTMNKLSFDKKCLKPLPICMKSSGGCCSMGEEMFIAVSTNLYATM